MCVPVAAYSPCVSHRQSGPAAGLSPCQRLELLRLILFTVVVLLSLLGEIVFIACLEKTKTRILEFRIGDRFGDRVILWFPSLPFPSSHSHLPCVLALL